MVDKVISAQSNRLAYDCLASEYESKADIRLEATRDRVKYFSNFISGTDVLDVGCGIGQDIQHFINLGYITTGIDISPQMVGYARRRNPRAKIIEGDFLAMDFNRTFDAISEHSFLHLFPKEIAIQIIKKTKQLLVPGGIAFFVTGGADKSQEGWEPKSGYKVIPLRYKKSWTMMELHHCLVDICGFEYLNSATRNGEGKKWHAFVVRKPEF